MLPEKLLPVKWGCHGEINSTEAHTGSTEWKMVERTSSFEALLESGRLGSFYMILDMLVESHVL